MPNYILPCSCGQQIPVSTSQAGQNVTCSCGAGLEVPTLRGLRALKQAEKSAADAPRWEGRHRTGFVLLLISLASLALGGYLALQLPPEIRRLTPEEIIVAVNNSSPRQVYALYEELQQGIGLLPAVPEIASRRTFMLSAVSVAFGIGLCGLVAAAAVSLAGQKKSL